LLKFFYTISLFIFLSHFIWGMENEIKVEENFSLSEELNLLSEEINNKEEKYLNSIKNLKIKHYLLSKKIKEISNLENKRNEFIELKIKEWKEILTGIEIQKSRLPTFLKEKFRIEKDTLFSLFNEDIDFELKAEAFKSFFEKENFKSMNFYFKESSFLINNEKKSGKALIGENSIVIIKTENILYLWDKKNQEYQKFTNPLLEKIFSGSFDENFFKPVFIDLDNEKN